MIFTGLPRLTSTCVSGGKNRPPDGKIFENAPEAFMLMRAILLSEQWENEIAATRKRWQTGGARKHYRWQAEVMLQSVKLEDDEAEQLLNIPEISADLCNAA